VALVDVSDDRLYRELSGRGNSPARSIKDCQGGGCRRALSHLSVRVRCQRRLKIPQIAKVKFPTPITSQGLTEKSSLICPFFSPSHQGLPIGGPSIDSSPHEC
jgi:hypothetical protein